MAATADFRLRHTSYIRPTGTVIKIGNVRAEDSFPALAAAPHGTRHPNLLKGQDLQDEQDEKNAKSCSSCKSCRIPPFQRGNDR
jgi:hypothetical protein